MLAIPQPLAVTALLGALLAGAAVPSCQSPDAPSPQAAGLARLGADAGEGADGGSLPAVENDGAEPTAPNADAGSETDTSPERDGGHLDGGSGSNEGADAGAAIDPSTTAGELDEGVDLGDGVRVRPSRLLPGGSATITYTGRLARASQLKVHFGFNGWNELGSRQSSEADGTGNRDFFAQEPMHGSFAEGWEAEVRIPEGARALHFVVFAEQPGGWREWDNNAGRDWQRGVGVPLVGPLLVPGSSLEAAPDVVFHTGHACRGWVELGKRGESLSVVARDDEAVSAHRLSLPPLEASSDYDYRAGCSPAEVSEVHGFRSPPPPEGGELSFLVLGDAQWTGEGGRWPDVAETVARRHAETSFLVFVGDMPWNDRPGLWWSFFDGGRQLLASKIFLAVPGNHDTPTVDSHPDVSNFLRYLATPRRPEQRSFFAHRFGRVLFLGLDSERRDELRPPGGLQLGVVSGGLAAAPPAEWAFAFLHVPPYNAGARHAGAQASVRDLTSLFDGQVDFVFSGHEHLYQRFRPLRYNGTLAASARYGRGSSDGTGYVVVPPAGAWPATELAPAAGGANSPRQRLASPVLEGVGNTTQSENGYVVVRLTGGGAVLELEAFGVGNHSKWIDPHLLDRVVVERAP